MRPLLLLDLDDILCLNKPYGGYDVAQPQKPEDLWERLFEPKAKQLLVDVLERLDPRVVMTTSWLRLMEREGFVTLFEKTGLTAVTARFHEHWEALPLRNKTRADAIDKWLSEHHRGEPYAILDDSLSGTGLKGSVHDNERRVVWCEVDVGLTEAQLPVLNRALSLAARPLT